MEKLGAYEPRQSMGPFEQGYKQGNECKLSSMYFFLKFKSVSLTIYINSLWSWSNLQLSSNKESDKSYGSLKSQNKLYLFKRLLRM